MRDASGLQLAFVEQMTTTKRGTRATARKVPVQDRSKRAVEAILQASSQVLVRRKYERAHRGLLSAWELALSVLPVFLKQEVIRREFEKHFKEELVIVACVTNLSKYLKDTLLLVSIRSTGRTSTAARAT